MPLFEGQDHFLYSWRKLQEWQKEVEAASGGGGDRGREKPGASNQRPRDRTVVRWIWVTAVPGFAEAQSLTSSQAGLGVTSAHLSEIFFEAINYYI